MWQTKILAPVKTKQPIFIEGLPGIGNVGKIAIDILIDELKAKKILELFSYSLPNSVFVNEKNLIDLPKIELFHKNVNGQDFLFLSGDSQPAREEASYLFSEKLITLAQEHHCKLIITLGGIGLSEVPKQPRVFCTGNAKEAVDQFKGTGVNPNIYGVVGPIVGVSGLLLGLSKEKKIPAASLLAETYGHPMYIGLPGARETLRVLVNKYKFKVNTKELDEEVKAMEKNIQAPQNKPLGKKYIGKTMGKETNYIG